MNKPFLDIPRSCSAACDFANSLSSLKRAFPRCTVFVLRGVGWLGWVIPWMVDLLSRTPEENTFLLTVIRLGYLDGFCAVIDREGSESQLGIFDVH